jgi:alkanesulfonate monooxygenase SsuD/methylene tetrahydromethanopterin reductase-like flavin-dependent oxidoreductase (luciferase family)
VEVGLFFAFRNPEPWWRPHAELYADVVEQIELADRAGFDGVWVGEHHCTDDGFAPSPLTLASAIAVATTRVQIGTYVLLLPQHDPVRLAEAATAVDILSGGRLILGLGLGYRTAEYEAIGADVHTRGDRMDEYMEILVRCFTERVFSFKGRYFDLHEVAMTPKPVQEPMPRIILGGVGDRMLRRAARFGCSGLANAAPLAILERHQQLVAEHGQDPSRQRYYGMALGFVGATDEAAWKIARDHAAWERDHYNDWFEASGLPRQFPNGLEHDFLIGSPQRWLSSLQAQLDGPEPLRCDHLVVELTTSGMAHAEAMRGIELFAEKVLPALHAR